MIFNILTMLLGGVAAALLGHVFTQARGDREHMLKKLEELCLSLDAHSNSVTQWLVGTASNDYAKSAPPSPGKDAENYSVLTMLTHLYFPQLVPALEAIDAVKNEGMEQCLAMARLGANDRSREQPRRKLIELAQRFNALHFEFRRKLIALARNIRQGSLLSWVKDFFGF